MPNGPHDFTADEHYGSFPFDICGCPLRPFSTFIAGFTVRCNRIPYILQQLPKPLRGHASCSTDMSDGYASLEEEGRHRADTLMNGGIRCELNARNGLREAGSGT